MVAAVGKVGLDQRHDFETLHRRLDGLLVPGPAQVCHNAVTNWLEEMIAACASMVEVGDTRELQRLKDTQEHLAASRTGARVFNTEYEHLLAELKRRVGATQRRRSRLSRLRRLLPGSKPSTTPE